MCRFTVYNSMDGFGTMKPWSGRKKKTNPEVVLVSNCDDRTDFCYMLWWQCKGLRSLESNNWCHVYSKDSWNKYRRERRNVLEGGLYNAAFCKRINNSIGSNCSYKADDSSSNLWVYIKLHTHFMTEYEGAIRNDFISFLIKVSPTCPKKSYL